MNALRKTLCSLLVLLLVLGIAVPALAADVQLSRQKLAVDGVEIDCEKYNIDGSNYFKLRDLAYALRATGSAFAVGWDEEKQVVSITTGQAYTPIGGELAAGADNSASAQVSTQTIVIDGQTVEGLAVYNIGGSNFFKLRDLGDALGFAVGYDEASQTATVASAGSAGSAGAPQAPETPETSAGAGENAEEYIKAAVAAITSGDAPAAVEWFRKAAELGNVEGQLNLAYAYMNGLGTERNYSAGVEWYRKAAEQGDPNGQYELAYAYMNGTGVAQDYHAGFEWFLKAAEQGHSGAQCDVGICYIRGDGVEKDPATGVEWLRKSVEQGNYAADYYLRMYESGQLV